MELIDGAQDKRIQRQAARLLSEFAMVYLTEADLDWVMQQLLAYRLSHNVSPFDCLIASASYRLQVPLLTLNLKHFAPLLGSLAQRPY